MDLAIVFRRDDRVVDVAIVFRRDDRVVDVAIVFRRDDRGPCGPRFWCARFAGWGAMLTVLAFVESEAERAALAAAAHGRGDVAVTVCDTVTDVLVGLERRWPDVVLLDLGAHEEEVALLCRAARKRADASARPLRIVLVDRGAKLVEDLDEARSLGADHLLDAPASAEALLAGLLPADARAAPVTPARVPTPSAMQATDGTPRRTLDDLLQHVRQGHYFGILGVRPDAETPEIAEAHVTLRQQLADARTDSDSERTRAILDEVEQGVADAWHVLGDARLRQRYRDALRSYQVARRG